MEIPRHYWSLIRLLKHTKRSIKRPGCQVHFTGVSAPEMIIRFGSQRTTALTSFIPTKEGFPIYKKHRERRMIQPGWLQMMEKDISGLLTQTGRWICSIRRQAQ